METKERLANVEGDYDEIVASIKAYRVQNVFHHGERVSTSDGPAYLNWGLFSLCSDGDNWKGFASTSFGQTMVHFPGYFPGSDNRVEVEDPENSHLIRF